MSSPALSLSDLILKQIAESPQQRLPFSEFMKLALYHPLQGYYATQASMIGPRGDFITSPHLGRDFGELLAEQFVEMWQVLGSPCPFQLVEMGAGQGLLAVDILAYLQQHYPNCFAALSYTLVETSPTLVAAQRQRLEPWQDQVPLRWQTLEDIPVASITGCLFSNELVDAFPVHCLEVHQGALKEVYVGQGFQEELGPLSTERIQDYFAWLGIDLCSDTYPEGYRTEVNLAALDWVDAIATRLQTGFLLTIDYGYPAHRYYNPNRRQGTLQCYYHHRHHNDPYQYIGQQDLTAHVDFTALQKRGEQRGLQTVGFTQQALFLMALGLGERMATLTEASVSNHQGLQAILQRRNGLRQLIDPTGLGNFGVLIQSQGFAAPPNLKGLWLPPG